MNVSSDPAVEVLNTSTTVARTERPGATSARISPEDVRAAARARDTASGGDLDNDPLSTEHVAILGEK